MPKFLKIRSLAAVLPLLVAAACAEAVKPVNGNNDDLFAPVKGGSGGEAGSGDAGSAGTGGAGAAGESGAAGTSGSSGQSSSAAGNAGTAGSAGTSAGSAGYAGAAAGNAGAGSAGKAGAGGSAGGGASGGAGGADSPFGGGGTSGKAGSGATGGAGGDPNPFGGGGTSSGTCDHSPCDIGIPLDPTCDSCASIVCSEDAFCCEVEWDDVCAGNAVDLCNNCSGSGGGPAACAHDPCTSGAALKKGCDPCVTAVCASDSFCCNTAWDSICVGKAQSACGTTCP